MDEEYKMTTTLKQEIELLIKRNTRYIANIRNEIASDDVRITVLINQNNQLEKIIDKQK